MSPRGSNRVFIELQQGVSPTAPANRVSNIRRHDFNFSLDTCLNSPTARIIGGGITCEIEAASSVLASGETLLMRHRSFYEDIQFPRVSRASIEATERGYRIRFDYSLGDRIPTRNETLAELRRRLQQAPVKVSILIGRPRV